MRRARRHLSHRLVAVAAVTLAVEACGAGWHQPPELSTGPLAPRQQVQVWRQGSVVRWHSVTVAVDSMSGVPLHPPVECDSCRAAISRASVDSVRLGNPVAAFWKSAGLVAGVFVAYCMARCPRGD